MRLSRPLFARTLAAASLAAALSCAPLPAFAHNGEDHSANPAAVEQARQQAADHTQAMIALQKRWEKAQGAEKSRALQQLIAKAEGRRAFLLELMETNPAEVLRVAIPEEKQLGMPAEVVEKLEQKLELSGTLEVSYEDRADGSHRLRHVLKTDFDERLKLHFAGKYPEIMNGNTVTVQGILFTSESSPSDGDMALTQEALTLAVDGGATGGTNGGTAQASPYNVGAQSTLVVNFNFQDNPVEPWTPAQARSVVFDTANNFIKENSFNQAWLAGDVTEWLTLSISPAGCYDSDITEAARNAAIAAGYNVSNYTRLIFAMPPTADCGFSGVGSVGGIPSSMLINGSMQWYTIAHEMGHNLGLFHSHALECGTNIIGSNCSTDEYGDGVDIMGRVAGHYTTFQKERLGWLDSNDILTVTDSGSKELETYAAPPGQLPKALKISKGTDAATGNPAWYYVEFRGATGFDAVLANNANVQNGVVIHSGVENKGNTSYMLDMTPGSKASNYTDTRDPALEVGYSFTDPEADITLTTNWVDGGTAQVDVQLPGGTATCTRANPTISMTPGESTWVEAGTSVSYQMTVTSRDSSACSSSGFNLGANAPSGWTSQLGSASLSLAPGESRTTTLKVTSPVSATDGFYNVNTSASSGGYSATGSVTYVVDNPVANTAPTASNDSASTHQDTAVTINVLSNDSDPDGDDLSVTGVAGVNGTANINADGSITFTPANGFSGTETFSYSISDGKGGSDSAYVSVSVAPATSGNSAPEAQDDSVTLSSVSEITIPVLANDWDPEGTALTINAVNQGNKGEVRINANGTLTYIPGKPFKTDDSFSYSITDGDKTATAMVYIQLNSTDSDSTGGKGIGKGNGNKP